jgi:hypothetical protein
MPSLTVWRRHGHRDRYSPAPVIIRTDPGGASLHVSRICLHNERLLMLFRVAFGSVRIRDACSEMSLTI